MTSADILVRESVPEDQPQILDLLVRAFPGEDLRPLVSSLLSDPAAAPSLSLVADRQNRILGHILFTSARIEGVPDVKTALLAPLAVGPEDQGAGIGTRLVRTGLDRLRQDGTALVLVLGDPEYYGRAGFGPAADLGIEPPYPLPDAIRPAWQGQILDESLPPQVKGYLRPAPAFDDPALWAPPPEE